MKVLLLNDGGYGDMGNVVFPVEVEADPIKGEKTIIGFDISGAELYRIGASSSDLDPFDKDSDYYFSADNEAVPA